MLWFFVQDDSLNLRNLGKETEGAYDAYFYEST